MKWTESQKKIIEGFRNKNLLVSAAAGSGKTTVLVERIIELITAGGIDIDRLLVVTFTRAAAAEMRQRIQLAIEKRIAGGEELTGKGENGRDKRTAGKEPPDKGKNGGDERNAREESKTGNDRVSRLRRQLDLLNRATICTLHSFCREIIQKNFFLLGIDPSFRVAESSETQLLMEEALEEVLEEYYGRNDRHFIELVESYSSNRGDREIEGLVLALYKFMQSSPQPAGWLTRAVEMFREADKPGGGGERWQRVIVEKFAYELEAKKGLLEAALKLCRLADGPREYAANIEDDLAGLKRVSRSLEKGLGDFYQELSGLEFSRLKPIRGRRKEEVDPALQDEVKALRKSYQDSMGKFDSWLIAGGIEEYFQQLKRLYPVMRVLGELVQDFSATYSRIKQERGVVDFNDLEHYALQVLENGDVAASFRKKYRYIFVDEYQDSNLVQEELINRIKGENNLFLVGDVKQSIYRFRLADPSLFLQKYHDYDRYEPGREEGYGPDLRIDLSLNFRSRREIIDGINFLFSRLMSERLGELDYDRDAYLYPGLEFKPVKKPGIELHLLEADCSELKQDDSRAANGDAAEAAGDRTGGGSGEDPETGAAGPLNDPTGLTLEELEELNQTEVEARFIAGRIKELLGEESYLPKRGGYQELNYRDMVILLRSPRNKLEVYQEVFHDEGIPLYADDDLGFFETLEVKIFLNLLRLLDNRRQDLPLLSVMRSYIGRFTVDELADIRLTSREGGFYQAVEACLKNGDSGSNPELRDKIRDFFSRLDRWQEAGRHLSMDEFIWQLLQESGFYYYVGAMPGGKKRQANLRILVDRAGQFEEGSYRGLFNYLRYVKQLKGSGGDLGTAKLVGESENVVRIMSVHKSKGLEFPVIFLADLGKKFNLQDLNGNLLLHQDLGLGPRYVDTAERTCNRSLAQLAVREEKRLENLSEEMRILYVALTRAIDRLILVGSSKGLKQQSRLWTRGAETCHLLAGKNYLDWICAVLARHRDGEVIREMAGIELAGEEISDDDSSWQIMVHNRRDIIEKTAEERLEETLKKEELLHFQREVYTGEKEEIFRRLNWEYQYRAAVNLPSKISVTELKQAAYRELENRAYRIPELNNFSSSREKAGGFSGAERGTIVHFVMQRLNLEKTDVPGIKEQLEMMVERELLSEEEAAVVVPAKLERFFQSEIGRRLLKADEIHREAPFVLKKRAAELFADLPDCREEILIQGIIDCYFREGEEIILLDYKTDYLNEEGTGLIKERYGEQLELYREALERLLDVSVAESYIYLFELDRAVKVHPGESAKV